MARQRVLMLCFLGGSILLLLLLASGLTGLTFRPGHFYALPSGTAERSTAGGVAPTGSTSDWLTAVFSLLGILTLFYLGISLILAIFSPKYRRYLLQQIMAIVFILLLFSLIGRIAGNGGQQTNVEMAPSQPQAQLPAGEPLPTFAATPTPWLTWTIILLLAALLIASIWFFWRRGRPPAAPTPPPLAEVAQQALTDIRAGGDLRDAVLRCYREMSRVLAEQQGARRDRTMTPREFAQHLRVTGLCDEHIERLTRLFERVRYGGRHASEREAQEAVACLTAIVAAYGERA